MPVVDIHKVSELITQASNEFIVPRYKMLSDQDIRSKSGGLRDLVTQADLDVEDFLSHSLGNVLDDSIIVGEEGVAKGDICLDSLKNTERPIWVIDPIDGTYNFVHGGRHFAVMVALVLEGRTQAAWIYDVLAKEMNVAELGEGAYCNGVRLFSHDCDDSREMCGHINIKYFPKTMREHIEQKRELFKSFQSVGSAGHEYLKLAKGQSHFSVYSRLKPWDHIPGSLIVREAGGIVNLWIGDDYMPYHSNTGIIGAAGVKSWEIAQESFIL